MENRINVLGRLYTKARRRKAAGLNDSADDIGWCWRGVVIENVDIFSVRLVDVSGRTIFLCNYRTTSLIQMLCVLWRMRSVGANDWFERGAGRLVEVDKDTWLRWRCIPVAGRVRVRHPVDERPKRSLHRQRYLWRRHTHWPQPGRTSDRLRGPSAERHRQQDRGYVCVWMRVMLGWLRLAYPKRAKAKATSGISTWNLDRRAIRCRIEKRLQARGKSFVQSM